MQPCRDAPRFPSPGARSSLLRRSRMDDVVNRMAKELSEAIAAAVGDDARVEACREKARAAGYEMRVSLEAVIGFVSRTQPGALARATVTAPAQPQKATAVPVQQQQRRQFEISAND